MSNNTTKNLLPLEDFINIAGRDLRSISWHSDGRIIAKSGASAKNPRKLYSGKTPQEALGKLIADNQEPVKQFLEEQL